jgi:hypothetical protein
VAQVIEKSNMMELFVQLLDCSSQCLATLKAAGLPSSSPKYAASLQPTIIAFKMDSFFTRWLGPLLLLLDLYECMAVVSKRKADLDQLVVSITKLSA